MNSVLYSVIQNNLFNYLECSGFGMLCSCSIGSVNLTNYQYKDMYTLH